MSLTLITNGLKFASVAFTRFFSKLSVTHWIYIGIGVVFLLAFKKIKAFVLAEIALYRVKTANDTTVKAVTLNVKEIARVAHAAIWGGGFKITEDEEAFVKAILQCPREYISDLAVEYAKIDGKNRNMFNDALKYLKTNQYNQIRHLFT